jgi:putrescine transport system ATP-binding protein
VTHDQEEAMAMSDYIAVMEKGRIAQFGAPRELYERPKSRFVASFLGTINLFEGSAVDVDSGHVRMTTPDGLQFLLARAAAIASSGICAVGFRPERLVVSRAPTGLPNDMTAAVEQVSYAGTSSHATLRLSSGRMLEVKWMNNQAAPGSGFATGEGLHVGFPSDAGVVLEA